MAKIGLNAALYIGAAGSGGVSYTEMCNVRDLTLNLERGEADISTRCSDIELVASTMQKLSIDFEMIWDEDDTDFAAILEGYVDNAALDIKCLSSTDGSGIEGEFLVLKCNRKESLKDAVMADISLKPTYVTRYPSWVDAS